MFIINSSIAVVSGTDIEERVHDNAEISDSLTSILSIFVDKAVSSSI